MKYPVDHSCGHQETHELFGKLSEREKRLTWLAERPCFTCYKEDQKAERARASIAAAQSNLSRKAVLLIGSPQQISGAERIRDCAFQALEALIAGDAPTLLSKTIQTKEVWTKVFKACLCEPQAKWWLDHLSDVANRTGGLWMYNLGKCCAARVLDDAAEAQTIGCLSEFQQAQRDKAQDRAICEHTEKLQALQERGRRLGLDGHARIWSSGQGQIRIYGNGTKTFIYFANGPRAGQLQNETTVALKDLKALCQEMLALKPLRPLYF